MKTNLAILIAVGCALVIMCAGCRVITFSQTSQDGRRTSVTMLQAFTKTDAYSCSLTPTNATLEAYKSGVDGKALGVAVGVAMKAALIP